MRSVSSSLYKTILLDERVKNVTKNFRTILGAMMPAKVTIFSGGGPELCFIVVSLLHQERAFEKREHESVTTRARDDGFDALARERAPQKRERE